MTDTIAAGVLPEFRVGTVLSQTFRTFFSNFPKFFAIGTLIYLPVVLYTYFFFDVQETAGFVAAGDFSGMMRGILISTVGSMVVMAIVQAAIAYGAIEYQAGRQVSMGGMIAVGVRSLVPVVAASIMIGVLYVIGAIFLIIPGVIILLMMSVSTPVIVAEKKGPVAAMGRSRDLTDGYKWQILGVFALLFILLYALMIGGALLAGMGFADLAQQNVNSPLYLVWQLVSTGAVYALVGSCVAAVYSNLRAAKEGTSADDIADVFA